MTQAAFREHCQALGWDIQMRSQKPPHERDVIVELFPKTSLLLDYSFYIIDNTKFFVDIPIRVIDCNNPSEKVIHDKLGSLVDRMLDLPKRRGALPLSAEREKIEREIAVTDEKIDEIVYGLYEITDEERKIFKKH